MSESVKVTAKKPEAKSEESAPKAREAECSQLANSRYDRILFLQKTIGNQGVQRLFKSGLIQAKLQTSKPGDIYEREADRLAEQVMRMAEPQVQRQAEEEEKEEEPIQTKPLAEQITPLVQRQQAEEPIQPLSEPTTPLVRRQQEEEEEQTLQAKDGPSQSSEVASDVQTHIDSARGGGWPLPESARAYFEPRFGCDFGQVRVHTDTEADALNRDLNASAFTTSQDIFFRSGEYRPDSSKGRELLAHELTHVVQQAGDILSNKFVVGQVGDKHEREADEVVRTAGRWEQQTNYQERAHHRVCRQPGEGSEAKAYGFVQRQPELEVPVQSKAKNTWQCLVHEGIDGEIIYRRLPTSSRTAKASSHTAAVLIATIIVRKNDNPHSMMTRALIELGLPKKKAQEFSSKLTFKLLTKPIVGKPYTIYLAKSALERLKKEVEAYEEGKTYEEGVTKGEGEGDGLGLIEVPSWVVTSLKTLDGILTVVGLFTGAGAVATLLKAAAKRLIKWAIKRAVKKAAKEAAKKAAKEALRKVSKKAAREGLQEAIEKTTKETTKRQIKKSVEKAAREALQKSMKKASKKEINKMAKELAEEVSEEISKKVAKRAARKAIKEATKRFLTRGGILRNARKARIPLDKLTKYSLNPNHPVGGHKAKQIKKLLGYDNTNYTGFLRQIKRGVVKNKAILGKADEYGQRFTVYIEMTGPKGKAIVESGWIFKPGSKIPQLVTVLIPK